MDGYNINPPAQDNIRPTEVPKAPPLPSDIKHLKDQIRMLKEEKQLIGTVILHQVNRIIREAEYLDTEVKDKLISDIWKGREK